MQQLRYQWQWPSLPTLLLLGSLLTAASGAIAEPPGHDGPGRNPGPPRGGDHPQQTFGHAAPFSPARAEPFPAPGYQIGHLPDQHQEIRVGSARYFYNRGIFYRPDRSGVYMVVNAPIGARVSYLPAGYVSFFIGPRHYFYVNYTYYLWDQANAQYVTVEEPEGATNQVVNASNLTPSELYVYPSQGQDESQQEFDKYQCYLWAVDQTGVDPSAGAAAGSNISDYQRAYSVCLEGRGYTVK